MVGIDKLVDVTPAVPSPVSPCQHQQQHSLCTHVTAVVATLFAEYYYDTVPLVLSSQDGRARPPMRKVYRLLKRKDISKSLLSKKVQQKSSQLSDPCCFSLVWCRGENHPSQPGTLVHNVPLSHYHRFTCSGPRMEDGTRPSCKR